MPFTANTYLNVLKNCATLHDLQIISERIRRGDAILALPPISGPEPINDEQLVWSDTGREYNVKKFKFIDHER